MTADWAQTALSGGIAIGPTSHYLRAHRGMCDSGEPKSLPALPMSQDWTDVLSRGAFIDRLAI